MAISDPTMSVPTPTGILQGVAAFNWDGSIWQPAGRAGPSVATPTGNLQGVAQFTGGPSWVPAGRASPGVATPTGVLDGVAVYTWSGSAWTPPGGSPTPSTSSGALRGVAAFTWDGVAWQPAGQAGPDVATPYGVLQGVAVFNYLAAGTRTNIWLYSGDLSNAATAPGGVGVSGPTITGGQIVAPDGTMTGARLSYPAVSAGQSSTAQQSFAMTAAPWTFSIWLRGNVGGETVWLSTTPDGVTYYRQQCVLTTAWWRFTLTTPNLTTGGWYWGLGVDRRDAAQTSQPVQTIFAWGAQVEQGTAASAYIPTTTAPVTRPAGWGA